VDDLGRQGDHLLTLEEAHMARVLVLGAGFGGIATATRLRALVDPVDEVVLVDRRADFAMGLRKTWAIVGAHPIEEGVRQIVDLRAQGIDVRQGTIDALDPVNRRVTIDGEVVEADAVVVALGAELVPGSVPGLVEHGINVWDRAQAEHAHDALALLAGGRLLVGVFGTPYACPPGPYELALLADEQLKARGAGVAVDVFGPMPIALPVVGPIESAKVEALLDAAGIPFHRGRAAAAVEEGVVHFADGGELAFDLLFAIPPHRCPQVLVDAGLAPATGWVGVDPATLATSFPGVYAIGDCTVLKLASGLPLPKAGLFAEAEGYVVAAQISARLNGVAPDARFTGDGVCYAEVGGGRAVRIEGGFLADPPVIEIAEPTEAHMAGKLAFETERLAAWFGG
jgi:sulfide:quinone oxidoreductase